MIVSVLFLPVLGLVVYLLVRASRGTGSDATPPVAPPAPAAPAVTADLERWREAGLLSGEQVDAILAHEQTHRPLPPPVVAPPAAVGPPAAVAPRRPMPDVAEALGYLGGILAIVGMSLLVGRYWSDIPVAGRLGLSGGASAVLFAVGLLVPEDREAALRRMRWFLWLVSSGAAAVFGGVLAYELVGDDDLRVPLAGAAAVVLHDAFLWWRRERPLQQFTCLAATAVAIGTGVAHVIDAGVAGIALWVAAAIGVVVGLRHLTPIPRLTLFVGAVTSVVGALLVSDRWAGASALLAVGTAAALLMLGGLRRLPTDRTEQLLLGVVGGMAALNTVPGAIGYFAEGGALATGLVVWALGAVLVHVGGRDWLRLPLLVSLVGAAALVGGAGITAIDLERVGPLFGIGSALALLALGVVLDRFVLSVVGSIGLLIHVPWAIVEWFPGEGRAPLLIMVSGALILAIATVLTRTRDHFPHVGGHGPAPVS